MSDTPFIARALESQGMFNKLLGREQKKNALVELNISRDGSTNKQSYVTTVEPQRPSGQT